MSSSDRRSGDGSRLPRKLFYGEKRKHGDDDDNGDSSERSDISVDDSVDDPEYCLSEIDADDEEDLDESVLLEGDVSGIGGDAGVNVGAGSSGVCEASRGRERGRGRGRGRGQRVTKVGRSRTRGEWESHKSCRLRNKGKAYVSVKSKK